VDSLAFIFIASLYFSLIICSKNHEDKITYLESEVLDLKIELNNQKYEIEEIKIKPKVIKDIERQPFLFPRVKALDLSVDEKELLFKLVESEAGNQSIIGRKLVAEVVINRLDSTRFPDNITDVIYEDGQFTVVSDKRLFSAEPTDETRSAVMDVINGERNTKKNVLFFAHKSIDFSRWTTKAFTLEDHTFWFGE